MKQNVNLFQADLRPTTPHNRPCQNRAVWITGVALIGLIVAYICTAAFLDVRSPEVAQEKIIHSRLIEVLS